MALDINDWKRIEELVHQAGGVANTPSNVPDMVRADAMAFHTLGLAIIDIHERITTIAQLMDSATLASNKPPKSKLIVPYALQQGAGGAASGT